MLIPTDGGLRPEEKVRARQPQSFAYLVAVLEPGSTEDRLVDDELPAVGSRGTR